MILLDIYEVMNEVSDDPWGDSALSQVNDKEDFATHPRYRGRLRYRPISRNPIEQPMMLSSCEMTN